MSCEMSGERKSTGKLFHTAAGALKPCIICFRYTVWRYLVLDHGRALRAKYLDRLENVDDALVSHPLQDDAQRDKHARPTDTGAASIPYSSFSTSLIIIIIILTTSDANKTNFLRSRPGPRQQVIKKSYSTLINKSRTLFRPYFLIHITHN